MVGKKQNQESYIEKAKARHGDCFDLSKIVFNGSLEKVEVVCRKCGETQFPRANNFISEKTGYKCAGSCNKRKEITIDSYIQECKAIYGDLYEYGEFETINGKKHIHFKCTVCKADLKKRVDEHKNGKGCKCVKTNMNKEKFIEKAKDKFGDRFDYSNLGYKTMHMPVNIKCNECQTSFEQLPSNHIAGNGCSNCSQEESKLTKAEFVDRAIQKHGDLYDYTDSIYVNHATKLQIKCKTCGNVFEQTANSHLQGKGCSTCKGGVSIDTQEFIQRAIKVHGDTYRYDRVDYKNTRTEVDIYCKQCSQYFTQTPEHHLVGHGCTLHVFKTQKMLIDYLQSMGYRVDTEVSFDDLCFIGRPRFDIQVHIGDEFVLIECDGPQHFRQISNWRSPQETKIRDEIKNNYCFLKQIPLIRISQEDVYYERIAWKEILVETIKTALEDENRRVKCIGDVYK